MQYPGLVKTVKRSRRQSGTSDGSTHEITALPMAPLVLGVWCRVGWPRSSPRQTVTLAERDGIVHYRFVAITALLLRCILTIRFARVSSSSSGTDASFSSSFI